MSNKGLILKMTQIRLCPSLLAHLLNTSLGPGSNTWTIKCNIIIIFYILILHSCPTYSHYHYRFLLAQKKLGFHIIRYFLSLSPSLSPVDDFVISSPPSSSIHQAITNQIRLFQYFFYYLDSFYYFSYFPTYEYYL